MKKNILLFLLSLMVTSLSAADRTMVGGSGKVALDTTLGDLEIEPVLQGNRVVNLRLSTVWNASSSGTLTVNDKTVATLNAIEESDFSLMLSVLSANTSYRYVCSWQVDGVTYTRTFVTTGARQKGESACVSFDSRTTIRIASESGESLSYDTSWYAGASRIQISDNGVEIGTGTKGKMNWIPTSGGRHLLTLTAYSSAGTKIAMESANFGGADSHSSLFVDLITEADADFAATTYDGILLDEELDAVVGTIQVKATKAKYSRNLGSMSSKLTVTIQLASQTKKVTFSDEYDLEEGGEQYFGKNGWWLGLTLGSDGLTGYFGSDDDDNWYNFEGVPNVYAAKDADSKAAASAADAAYVGTYNLIAEEGTFTVTVAKKGKVKVSGTTAAGKKVSGSAQLIVGKDFACAPIMMPKVGLSFAVWLGDEPDVDGLSNAEIGRPGTLVEDAYFNLDEDELAELIGDDTYIDYFPSDVPVSQSGTKWIVAEGAKAGKVVLTREGEVDEAKAGANPSALKLTYTAKTGAFKGSFKVYVNVRGKPSALSATVSGVMIDGCGYGTATIKKYGTIEIWVN